MTRMQFSPTVDQARAIDEEARASGRTVAAVLRDAVDAWRLGRERASRIERALAVNGGFHSGLHDVAERHDAYFVAGLEDEMRERWG
jgi:hypothetical protein